MKRLTIGMVSIFLFFAWPIFAQSPHSQFPAIRQHYELSDSQGSLGLMTELVYAGEPQGFVTLWRHKSGHQFVFRSSEHASRQVLVFGIVDQNRRMYLHGSMPYGNSPDRGKLSVATRGFRMVAALPEWFDQREARARAALQRQLDPQFLNDVRQNARIVAGAGSPAGLLVCETLVNAASAQAFCDRDERIVVAPQEENCEFDALFGYPCPRSQP